MKLMKKLTTMFLFICSLFVVLGLTLNVNAASGTEEIDLFANQADDTTNTAAMEFTGTYVSISAAKGGSAILYTHTDHARFYSGSTVTIAGNNTNVTVTSVVITASSNSYATVWANSTLTNCTVEVSSTTVTITPTDPAQPIVVKLSAQSRVKHASISYEISDNPYVTISSSSNNYMLGQTDAEVTVSDTNIADYDTVAWTSTNEDVATIADGKLTILALGTTTIYAEINGTKSNEIEVTIHHSNASPISIATAIEYCEEVGESNTFFDYTIIGTVEGDPSYSSTYNSYTFTLTDGTNSIKVYSVTGAAAPADGDKVSVTGPLTNYSGNTPEVNKGTFKLFYTVTFMVDDSQYGDKVEVAYGDKVSAPTKPQKTGYEFVGWYETNSIEEFDFENTAIESNLTLEAKWFDNTLSSFQAQLNTVKAYMALAYQYKTTVQVETQTDSVSGADYTEEDRAYKEWSTTKNGEYTVFSYTNSTAVAGSLQFRTTDNLPGIVGYNKGMKIKSVTINWSNTTSNGRQVYVYGIKGKYTAPSDLYSEATQGTLIETIDFTKDVTTQSVVNITGDYTAIGIRSVSGALYLTSVDFEWGGGYDVYSDVDFRIRVGIDKTLTDYVTSAQAEGKLAGAVYGIEVVTAGKTKRYYSTETLYQTDETGVSYVVISLGDVLNNPERLTEEFTVRAFVEYNGEFLYAEEGSENTVKTYSITGLVNHYATNGYAEQVANLKEIIEG